MLALALLYIYICIKETKKIPLWDKQQLQFGWILT